MSEENGKVCCNCAHNIRTGSGANIQCHCDIDNHYIGYVSCMTYWCRRWAKEKENGTEPSAEQQWILCSERMPEEREWSGTKDFGTTISDEVYVTFESPKGNRFCKHLCFQNGKTSRYDQMEIDAFHKGAIPIAWMPLPKPYEVKK